MKKTPLLRYTLLGLVALAVPACERDKSSVETKPAVTAATTAPAAFRKLEPWETFNEGFNGCAGACGMRANAAAEGAVAQPNAMLGDQTYCPVSGVVFEVKDKSPRRDINGRSLYFCCDGCAAFFDASRDLILAARGLV